ncbi:MAG: hypothetical protein NT059_06250 [Planctomycetota bacterium]|nr:hypothetical protein [Planctomycetota bacterium]
MNRARILAATALLVSTSLPACNGLHTPSPAEQGAKKMTQVTAKARGISSRITYSPDAVSKTLPVEGGEAKELAQGLLAPADAAKELRALATEVTAAAGSDSQRKEAKTLALRMRRDAMMLDLMDLERISQLKSALASGIAERLSAIRSIDASGDPRAPLEAAARSKASQGAKAAFDGNVSEETERADTARTALQPLDASIDEKETSAEALDIDIQTLRAKAATSTPSAALPLMLDARVKLDAAQTLRVAASGDDREAEPYRSTVRIADMATKGNAEIADTNKFLDARIEESSKAEEGAKARANAALKRRAELSAESGKLMKEFVTLDTELFQPALKNVEENINADGLTAKNSTDQAAIAIAKARFAAIQIDAVDQAMTLMSAAQALMSAAQALMSPAQAKGAGASGGEALLRAQRDKLLANAKTALIEARDALSGVEAAAASPMLRSIAELAAALGIEVPTTAAARPAPATTDDAAPKDDAAPANDAAPADPATDPAAAPGAAPAAAPGADPAAPPAPATDPAEPAADPKAPPADPAEPAADPKAPPADPAPAPEEPNK